MKQIIYLFLGFSIGSVLLSGCRKEDNTFKGTDNVIASLQLKKGELVLKAAITQEAITITAPGNISLVGAIATLVLSENATIIPEPASIEDWGIAHEFVVTAYGGVKRTYRYVVERNVISADGDVLLVRQADVDSLAALGISRINGSLTIGKTEGADSVYSLAALTGIKSITSSLIVNATFAGKNLEGLENLETVGSILFGPAFGSYTIGAPTFMDTLSLPGLTSVRADLVLNGARFSVIDLPSLTTVDGHLQLLYLDSLPVLKLPKLEQTLGSLRVMGSGYQGKLAEIELPVLKKAGELRIEQHPNLSSLKMPLLKDAQSFEVLYLPKLISVTAPELNTVYSVLDLSGNEVMTELNLSGLSKIGGNVTIENAFALKNLDGLASLKTVGGQFRLNNLYELNNWDGLKKLTSVGGNCQLMNIPLLNDPNVEGLQSLSTIGGDVMIYGVAFKKFDGLQLSQLKTLQIFGASDISIELIDISGIEVTDRVIIGSMSVPVTLKGRDVYDASVHIEGAAVQMEGFREVKDLTFTYYSDETPVPVQTLPVQKVTRNLTIAVLGFSAVQLPNLTEVVGKTRIDVYGATAIELPLLSTTGEMSLDVGGAGLDVFGIPFLETVKGNLMIATGANSSSIGSLQFPKLTTIEGKLQLLAANEYYANTSMTNLDGFKTLSNVQGIDVRYNLELKDFSGLKNALNSFAADQWSAIGNAYNPTYEDLKNGKYIQP